MCKPLRSETFVHQEFHGLHLGKFLGLSNPHISKTRNFIFSQNSPPSNLALSWCTNNLGQVQTPPNSNFRAPRISWSSFGDISRPLQPSHLKNHEFHFFTKLPTKQSSSTVVHRQPWPCANPSELKLSCTKNFRVFIWGHFYPFPTLTSQKPRISFFHKTPHQAI